MVENDLTSCTETGSVRSYRVPQRQLFSPSSNNSKEFQSPCLAQRSPRQDDAINLSEKKTLRSQLACHKWSGEACVKMNDAATQEKSGKENPGPVVAAGDAGAVAI